MMRASPLDADVYSNVLRLLQTGGDGVLVTVVESEGSAPVDVGAKMLVLQDGTTYGTVGGGAIEMIAKEEALRLIRTGNSALRRYSLTENGKAEELERTGMICGGSMTLFYEYIAPATRLFIFGAGHIGRALLYHLKNLPYHTTIIDSRSDFIDEAEPAHRKVLCDYGQISKLLPFPSGSFFIIVTHSHRTDYLVLRELYRAGVDAAYIGMIASRKKARALVEQLIDDLDFSPDLSILHTPIGIDIGGDSPDEIALSIIAEIQAVRYGRVRIDYMRENFPRTS